MFWDKKAMQSRDFGGIFRMHLQCPKIGKVRNQHEAGSNRPLTTWRYIPEDEALHDHPCENPKS
jgi:hypothetical protein